MCIRDRYTVVYDGFVNGETEAVLTGTLVVTCDYKEESREYTYEIVPSGLSAKNYAITWKNGVLTARYPESDSCLLYTSCQKKDT